MENPLFFHLYGLYALAGGGTGAEGGPGMLMQFIPLILIFVIFWFLLIRPQQKRAKAHRTLLETLKEGDEVIMESGIQGTIRKLGERMLTVEIAPKVQVKVVRSRIAERVQSGSAEGAPASNKTKAKPEHTESESTTPEQKPAQSQAAEQKPAEQTASAAPKTNKKSTTSKTRKPKPAK